MTTLNGTIVRANATFCRWTGYAPDEFIEHSTIQLLLTVGGRLLFSAQVAPSLLLQRSVVEVRVDVTRRTGGVLPTMFNVSRTRHGDDEFDEYSFFVVEERHRYETALIDARRKAEQGLEARAKAESALQAINRRKDEFLATLAHEPRNPLAPMRNVLEIFSLKVLTDPQLIWGRDVFKRQVHHMTRLVDDLLEMSRITQGKLELRKARVDLVTVLTSAIEDSRANVLASSHELNVAIPGEPILLDVDPTRLLLTIQNLLDNAVKFTPPGGKLWLSAHRSGNDVVITVRDNGIGIPQADLESIFEMFSQLQNAIDRSQGGLGIRLALVGLHGGSVQAHSQGPGQGSELVVRLPVAEEQSIASATRQPSMTRPGTAAGC